MGSEDGRRQIHGIDIADQDNQRSETAPLYIPSVKTWTRQHSDSWCGSYEDSSADSSYGTKRPPESMHILAESKRGRHGQDLLTAGQGEENDDNCEQKPEAAFDNDVMLASQGSVISTQVSLTTEDELAGYDHMCVSDDENIPLTQADATGVVCTSTTVVAISTDTNPNRANHVTRTTKAKETQLSGSQEGFSDHDQLPAGSQTVSDKLLKQRQNNRKYARDSRNKKNKKLEELEQLKIRLECIIEIYTKTIVLYHKRLKKGTLPTWVERTISWYTGNASGQGNCQTIDNCLLPMLDDNYLEELGNGPYGTIVPAGGSKISPIEPSSSRVHGSLLATVSSRTDDGFTSLHVPSDARTSVWTTQSSNTSENSNSGSHLASISCPCTPHLAELTKMDDNGFVCQGGLPFTHPRNLEATKRDHTDNKKLSFPVLPNTERRYGFAHVSLPSTSEYRHQMHSKDVSPSTVQGPTACISFTSSPYSLKRFPCAAVFPKAGSQTVNYSACSTSAHNGRICQVVINNELPSSSERFVRAAAPHTTTPHTTAPHATAPHTTAPHASYQEQKPAPTDLSSDDVIQDMREDEHFLEVENLKSTLDPV